jgi:hypothetical protein
MKWVMPPALLDVVDQLRTGALDRRSTEEVLAKFEFDLADQLADGPWAVELLSMRLLLRPGLEHHELRTLLKLLMERPPDLRTALWVADLDHVAVRRSTDAPSRSVRRHMAPDAALQPPQSLPPGDLRRLAEDDQLDWLGEAESIPAERAPPVQLLEVPPRRTPARWRRFVQDVLSARPGPGGIPPLGLLCAAFDDLVRTGDIASARSLLEAAGAAEGPHAPALRSALDHPDRMARRMSFPAELCRDTPSGVFAAMLHHRDPETRTAALALLIDRRAPETSPALTAFMRSSEFHDRPPPEKRQCFDALDRINDRGTDPLLLSILKLRDKRRAALAESQIMAVELLGRRWSAAVDQGLRRVTRGVRLHRDVRKAVRTVLHSRGRP